MLFEIVFRVKHDCPFGCISAQFPSLRMAVWHNPDHELIEMVTRDHNDYQKVIKELSKFVEIIEKHLDDNKMHLVTSRFLWTLEQSIGRNIERYGLLHVAPEIYERGWEYYHVIAFRHRDLEEFLRSVESKVFKIEIMQKSFFRGLIADSLAMTTHSIFSDLTKKQIETLLMAVDNGYYKLPRKSSLATIAEKRHVPVSTLAEHLRKAENKLVKNLAPYLRLFDKDLPTNEQ